MWNVIDESDDSTLPQVDFGYFLVTLQYYDGTGIKTVDKSFYTKDRELAKKHHRGYSRKHQGKQSVHFEQSGCNFRVLAWMEIPKPYENGEFMKMKICNLKEGDFITALNLFSDRGTKYEVITNIVDDVLFLWNEDKAKGYHIFYDDEEDLKFAKFKFGLEV